MSASKIVQPLPVLDGSQTLPDGRQLVLSWADDSGELALHAPDGQLEITIQITPEGPVLQLSGGRIELKSTDSVSIQSREIHLDATEKTTLRSGDGVEIVSEGDTEVTAQGDVRILASMIHLN